MPRKTKAATAKTLARFVAARNASAFSSNMQVQIDADATIGGIGNLGDAEVMDAGMVAIWRTPAGIVTEDRSKPWGQQWSLSQP